jgi:hypothetical protein
MVEMTSRQPTDMANYLNLYCALMEEAKVRISIVEHMLNNDSGLPPAMAREICYLEFRMLCEIIAVACLTAHGDAPEAVATGRRQSSVSWDMR